MTETEQNTKVWDDIVDGKEPKDDESSEQETVKEDADDKPESEPEGNVDTDEAEEGSEGNTVPDAGAEEPEEPADPWTAVPEELRLEHEKQAEKLAKFEHENRSNRARVAALQKKVDSLSAKEDHKPSPKEPPVKDLDAMFSEDDDWKKFEEDFSDVAKPIKAAISRSVDTLRQRLEKAEKLVDSLSNATHEQRAHSELQALNNKVSDWFEVINGNQEEFATFLDDPSAPKPIRSTRNAIRDANAEEIVDSDSVAWLVNDFKTHLASKNTPAPKQEQRKPDLPKSAPAPLPPKREKQLRSAVSVPPKSAPSPGRGHDDLPETDDPKALFNAFDSMLEKQAR